MPSDMKQEIDCEVSRNCVANHSEVRYPGSQVLFLAYSLWKPVYGAVEMTWWRMPVQVVCQPLLGSHGGGPRFKLFRATQLRDYLGVASFLLCLPGHAIA